MSFTPLPTSLVLDLRRAAGEAVVELGCGEGRLTRRLTPHHSDVIGIDRERPVTSPGAVADAAAPPLRSASVAVLVMGNLYRYLDDGGARLRRWRDALQPGGVIWILEDEPAADGEPGALYRDLQAYLDTLVHDRRGALLPLDRFRAGLDSTRGWTFGRERNTETMEESGPLLAGLDLHASKSPAAARIAAAIRADGLDYGHYWWARWAPEATP